MIVGFVNVGLMTLTQAASVIMGANIGTTISAFVMALSTAGGAFSVAAVFALVAFVGFVITLVAKKVKRFLVALVISLRIDLPAAFSRLLPIIFIPTINTATPPRT